MVARLAVRLERAGLFFFVEDLVRDRFRNGKLFLAGVIELYWCGNCTGSGERLLKFIDPMVQLFDAGEKRRQIIRLSFCFEKLCYLFREFVSIRLCHFPLK